MYLGLDISVRMLDINTAVCVCIHVYTFALVQYSSTQHLRACVHSVTLGVPPPLPPVVENKAEEAKVFEQGRQRGIMETETYCERIMDLQQELHSTEMKEMKHHVRLENSKFIDDIEQIFSAPGNPGSNARNVAARLPCAEEEASMLRCYGEGDVLSCKALVDTYNKCTASSF